jgi:hypothetical protein
MNWNLLFCDFVTENGKKHRHILVVVVLLVDIALNCIIGLTPYVDNFTRTSQSGIGYLSDHKSKRFAGLVVLFVKILVVCCTAFCAD